MSATGGERRLITNRDLNFRPVQLIGLHLGVLIAHQPTLFDELTSLVAAGVVPPGSPTVYALADGRSALAALESRSTVGKLALRP